MRLINNLKEYPDRFGPLDDAITTLAEVRPKHTIIAFIQTPTDNLRLEAQLDERVGELQQADDGSERWTVEYQFGTTKLVRFTNTCAEIPEFVEGLTRSTSSLNLTTGSRACRSHLSTLRSKCYILAK